MGETAEHHGTGGVTASRPEKEVTTDLGAANQNRNVPAMVATEKTSSPSAEPLNKQTMVSNEDVSSAEGGVPEGAEKGRAPYSPPPPLPPWRYALLALGLGLGLFLAMLDTSIVATCMYSIAIEFDTLDSINWVALAYTLTYLGFAVLFASISDVVGRKAAFLAAYVIFIAFSLGCGFSQSMEQLIVCRAFQGVGGSGLYSIAIIVLPESTPDSKRRFIAAFVGVVIAVSGVLGPVIGGLLTHYRSWRYVFWINGPIGGVSAAIFFLAWPKKEFQPRLERRAWKDVDYVGSFLLVAASVLIVFPFQNAGGDTGKWGQAVFIAPLVVGILCGMALFGWEYYVERRWGSRRMAAVPLDLIRNRALTSGILVTMLVAFPYFICIYSFPTRFQVVNGKSALDAGLMLLPMLAAAALGSMLSGAISAKKNRLFETLVVACVLMIIGCALETTVSDTARIEPKVIGFLAFVGLGFGLSVSSATILANIEAPIKHHAPAQGIVAQVRILGGSIGIAASSAILAVKQSADASGVLTPSQMASIALNASNMTAAESAVVRKVYTQALREDMIVCTAVLGVAFFIALCVYRKDRLSIDELLQVRRQQWGSHREGSDKAAPDAS